MIHAPEEVIAALRFEPVLPLWLIVGLGGVRAPDRGGRRRVARARHGRRLAAFAVLLLWLAGPRLVQETRDNLPDIGLLVVDQTASMQVGERARLAEAARATISQQAAKLPDLELRTVTVPESGDSGHVAVRWDRAGARRYPALAVRRHDRNHRRAGARHSGEPARWRAAQRADPGEGGGIRSPPAGDRSAELRHRGQDRHPARGDRGPGAPPRAAATANLTIRRDGEPPRVENVPIGAEQRIELPITRAGPTVVELSANMLPGEVSTINNRAVVEINGVRDRLRVLLIRASLTPASAPGGGC